MPSYVVASNAICQVTIRGRHENQEVMSVFHYRYTDSSPIADGAAALDAIWAKWEIADGMLDYWCQAVSEKVVAVETRLQWITPSRFAYVTKTSGGFGTGQVAGPAYPVNTACCITKRTVNAGRQNVGTTHMPGVAISFMTDGAVNALGLAKYAQLAFKMTQEIITAGAALHLSPVLFHKSSPDISPIFVNTTVQPTARVERRRTVGLGS